MYSIARGVNKGRLDPIAFGPAALLGWEGGHDEGDAQGELEGTCSAPDGLEPCVPLPPADACLRGAPLWPVLMAGGEVIDLVKKHRVDFNDSSVQFYRK